jgi:sugar-specific transcriptional regulator TrmB
MFEQNKLIPILEKTGLNKPEILVYLNGLKTGPVLASFLAKKTGVTRQHIYDILNSLEQKGLASTTGKNYNKRFVMESPLQLKNILERKKRNIEKLEKQIDLLNIEFESSERSGRAIQSIAFYEDIEGIKNIWEKSLTCKDNAILSIAPIKDIVETLGKDFIEYYLENRLKRNKVSRTLRVKPKEISDDWFKLHSEQKRAVKFLPPDIDISSTFLIYDDTVSIISSKKENAGFTLKSEELAESMKGIFEALWTKADES